MTAHFHALGLILLFPLLGFLFNLFWGDKMGRRAVNVVGPGVIFAAFVVAVTGFIKLHGMPAGSVLTVTLWPWIHAGRFSADFALQMDALSALMTLIVTGVGALIHMYSVGYMAHDEDFARFFAYLNLFELSMLILVLANNLLADVHGMGGRRAVLLSADFVLVHRPCQCLRRAQGLRRQPHRRRGIPARHVHHCRGARRARHLVARLFNHAALTSA